MNSLYCSLCFYIVQYFARKDKSNKNFRVSWLLHHVHQLASLAPDKTPFRKIGFEKVFLPTDFMTCSLLYLLYICIWILRAGPGRSNVKQEFLQLQLFPIASTHTHLCSILSLSLCFDDVLAQPPPRPRFSERAYGVRCPYLLTYVSA